MHGITWTYEEHAKKIYANSSDKVKKKALDAGIAMDNALKKEKSHFMIGNYLKYFDYEKIKHLI